MVDNLFRSSNLTNSKTNRNLYSVSAIFVWCEVADCVCYSQAGYTHTTAGIVGSATVSQFSIRL